jgi:hypothetical protein
MPDPYYWPVFLGAAAPAGLAEDAAGLAGADAAGGGTFDWAL